MSPPGQPSMGSDAGGAVGVTISSEILVAAIIFLFMVVVFVIFLYLYAKRYWGANPALRRSRAHFAFAAADAGPPLYRGLDPQVLKALPVTVYRPADFKEGLECAVCLSELSEGEEARMLPGCRHGFHLECIDMWLNFHSSCPLCRSPVLLENADSGVELAEASSVEAVLAAGRLPESPIFPTNMLFWGSQDQVRTGGPAAAAVAVGSCEESSSSVSSSSGRPGGKLVIDVPRRAMEGYQSPVPPLPLSRLPADEIKSPTSARLRSLRRLLSQGNRGIGSSCSLRGGDIEQGVVGVGVAADGILQMPKTSTSS